jgi:hypothetical protein
LGLEQQTSEIAAASMKVTPPVAVSAASLAGMSLQEWVLTVTLLYTVLQIVSLVYGWIKKRKTNDRA